MKFYTKKRRVPVMIILPLIDILAILLIFFIVTSTFKKKLPQLQINLPDSTSAVEAPTTTDKEPILLRVRGAEEITLNDRPVTLTELTQSLRSVTAENPGRSLALQADREAAFGVVVQILDSLKEAGIKNIPTFTQPQNSSPTP